MTGVSVAVLRGLVGVWLALTAAFMLLRILPGDVAQSQAIEAGMASSAIEDRRAALGLNRPVMEQYLTYLSEVSRGDLGASLVTGESVGALLISRGGNTLRLAALALVISVVLGILLGAMAGLSPESWVGVITCRLMDLLIAIPIYVSGTVAVMSGVLTGSFGAATVLGVHSAAAIANTLSIALMTERQQGYIVTAYGKGLPEVVVLWRHRLRVVLHTIVPVLSVQTGFLLGGTVITEAIFSQTGLGQSLLDGVLRRDYPVVQGWVLMMTVLQAIIYTVAQISLRWLDPRQRES